ncbi:MAG: YceI family protein [Verrucomicrobia bacterium]|nr:YceI family protein [Verrucomicrobiota bacterium]
MNPKHTTSALTLTLLLAGLGAGCSDPASDVPQATTGAAQPGAANARAAGTPYVLRAESKIGFVGSKVTGSHSGGFTNFAGIFMVDGGKIAGTPQFKIAMHSTWSDNDRLTGHLKNADFFEVDTYPVSTFTATALEPAAGGQHQVTGNLELHGVTKSISFPAAIEVGAEALTVKAEFAINRRDFNINYPGRPNDLIRDNVVIQLDLKATPGPARPEDQLAQ